MKLLRELNQLSFTKEQITESVKTNNGILKLKGIIQRADAKNQNGRSYPRDILTKAIEPYMKLVKERRSHGELDHTDEMVVNLKNASHIITDIQILENGDVMGEIEVLNTPMGNIVRALIEQQVTVGISSRAVGSIANNGYADVVGDDLHIVCWDMVSEPSTEMAFMFKEAKELSQNDMKKFLSKEQRLHNLCGELLSESNNKLVL